MGKNKWMSICTIVGLCMLAVGISQMNFEPLKTVWITDNITDALTETNDHVAGQYYTLYDQDTHVVIDYTARTVFEGDELITGDNKHYQVVETSGTDGFCKYLGVRTLAKAVVDDSMPVANLLDGTMYQAVAIYSTHTDESYVPTSGTESKAGEGDIMQVAATIADALAEQGVDVVYSDNTHDPHDVNAYQRSRSTAAELLQQAPIAIIDVHRDGIPDPAYYETQLEGQPATQIRLVVGKQNQNMEANVEFAEKMKAYYDEIKPGLIKSIYMAKGNYNQDMAPNFVLIEVGTHTNTLEQAEQGALLFADALPAFLGIATNATEPGETAGTENINTVAGDQQSTGISKAILWLIAIAVIGGIGFVFISKGSIGKK